MASDLSQFASLTYSGRTLHAVWYPNGDRDFAYTLTGRSPFSQARKMQVGKTTNTVYVEAVTDDDILRGMFDIREDAELERLKADIAKGVEQFAALIYYPAMIPWAQCGKVRGIAASNGVQTDLINSVMRRGYSFPADVLRDAVAYPFLLSSNAERDEPVDIASFEPDGPLNFTARVNLCWLPDRDPVFSSIKCIDGERVVTPYRPASRKVVLHSLPTYKGGNEKPRLLPFEGPLLEGRVETATPEEFCSDLYHTIMRPNPNDGNKIYGVAAAVIRVRADGTLVKPVVMNRAALYDDGGFLM